MKLGRCKEQPLFGVNQPPRIRVWPDEIEAKIDRIMARPDSRNFWIGMWGQIFDRDNQLVEDEEFLRCG